MYYINRKDSNGRETVDSFGSMREARDMLREYQIADRSGHYYISSRACRNWHANV